MDADDYAIRAAICRWWAESAASDEAAEQWRKMATDWERIAEIKARITAQFAEAKPDSVQEKTGPSSELVAR